ncbi:MAG: DUF1292 domain-containing protein [Firmicutes bacterium]|uniref:DUF1292 domain-containing protein n=1 Tax=Melghirimyces thermohalophilus TaxID=1236220 RepID=A0A1G6MZ91_9BACL|nr:DUF1292 domain-containing protein [Melghirimyces thermohalophilus]MDA8353436.1 DUF1292 domain-containing protein [Bacillota bacterium]SDC60908.1 Protein of unknown function [Melghirimyces thermohalophilus]
MTVNVRDEKIKNLNTLETELGQELILVDEEDVNRESRHRLIRELEVDGQHYAVLGGFEEDDPDDAYIFRVTEHQGNRRLEHVDEDSEWDQVADALDEMLYFDE